jgi:hypothetical protein
MARTIFSGVWRIGRVTALALGVAVMLALVVGAASVAFGADGDAWRLGKGNIATKITALGGQLGVDGPMVRLINNNADANDTALDLRVQAGEAPLRVNSDQVVTNLNADTVDGKDANELTRVGQISSSQSFTLLETDAGYGGVLLINAPAAGFVRVSGNVSAQPTTTAPCTVSATNGCYFSARIRHVNSGVDSQTSQDEVEGSFARGNVAMNAVFPVSAGENRFIIIVYRSPGGSGTLQVSSAQLTAEYTPYGSTG